MLVDELAGRRIYIEEVPVHGGDASATGRGLVEAAYEIGNALYVKLDRNEITPVPDLFIGGLNGEFLNIEYLED